MTERIAIFWPGDYRPKPNELALPNVEQATVQLERALQQLGRASYRIDGFLTKPHEAIEKLGPIDDPMIGVCVHWFYGPHTTRRRRRQGQPAAPRQQLLGHVAGPGRPAQHRRLPREREPAASRASGPTAATGRATTRSWSGSTSGARRGRIGYGEDERARTRRRRRPRPQRSRAEVADEIRGGASLALMLGDTSMGMINGYFGPRLLDRHRLHRAQGRSGLDHRPRQAHRARKRIDDAFRFVRDQGVTFHWGENGAADFTEEATREQLRDYLAVLDLVDEFKADCLGWQYQLGLLPLRPPSRLRRGPVQLGVPAGVERRHRHHAHRGRPGQPGADGDDEAPARSQGPAPGGDVPRRPLGRRARRALPLGAAQLADRAAPTPSTTIRTRCAASTATASRRGYFPIPGGTFAGESLPGAMTWARAYLRGGELWMDIGRGEVVKLPPTMRDAWWEGTTRAVAVHGGRPGHRAATR